MPGVTRVHPRRRSDREGPALPVRLHHRSPAARSAASTRSSPAARRPKMVDKESDCSPDRLRRDARRGPRRDHGADRAPARCPQEDYVAINTNPQVAIVASPEASGEGLARNADELERLDAVLTAHDRGLARLGRRARRHPRCRKKVILSNALALLEPIARRRSATTSTPRRRARRCSMTPTSRGSA